MLTLLLSRHATTWANEEGLWIGKMESNLSDQGYKEIEQLKEKIRPYQKQMNGIYTSLSLRTIETASTVIYQLSAEEKKEHGGKAIHNTLALLEIQPIEALGEINFGKWEGKNFAWAQKYEPEEVKKMLLQNEAYCYPEGESLLQFHERVASWLGKWLDSHTEGTYWICAHGGTVRSILSELLVGDSSLHWRFKIDPASLSVVTIVNGYAVIEALNC